MAPRPLGPDYNVVDPINTLESVDPLVGSLVISIPQKAQQLMEDTSFPMA